ncbi:carbohydrate ABC transporter permease [Verrucomicrobiota bacterium]
MSLRKITLGNIRHTWPALLLLAPVVLGIVVFRYTPAAVAIQRAFYNWDGDVTLEFTGLNNFRRLIGNLNLWSPFLLTCLLAGTSALMSKKGKLKSGLLLAGTVCLLATAVIMFRDALKPEVTWQARGTLQTVILLGAGIASAVIHYVFFRKSDRKLFFACSYLLPIAAGLTYLIKVRESGDSLLWQSFSLVFTLVAAWFIKMWPSIFAAVCIHRLRKANTRYYYRVLFVIPMIIPIMVNVLVWKFFYDANVGFLNQFLTATNLDEVFIWLDKWVLHWGVFTHPFKPAWLGDQRLIIPALILWGFPWVSVVGVLIYLAGLQNIGTEVYEAAEIDGISSMGKFWKIELPLIMTQVRLNIVLLIINTFQTWWIQMVLLGSDGGPKNKGLTPGLYMYNQAFIQKEFGYACSIGLALFLVVMIMTIINNKYVRVEK